MVNIFENKNIILKPNQTFAFNGTQLKKNGFFMNRFQIKKYDYNVKEQKLKF